MVQVCLSDLTRWMVGAENSHKPWNNYKWGLAKVFLCIPVFSKASGLNTEKQWFQQILQQTVHSWPCLRIYCDAKSSSDTHTVNSYSLFSTVLNKRFKITDVNWIYTNKPVQKFAYPWILILCIVTWMINEFMSSLFVLSTVFQKNPLRFSHSFSIFCIFTPFSTVTVWFWDRSFHTEDNGGTLRQLWGEGENIHRCPRWQRDILSN